MTGAGLESRHRKQTLRCCNTIKLFPFCRWTEDSILQSYFFCNTFRVLDKLSQYIIREVIEKGPQNPEEIAFRIILFNSFTKIETIAQSTRPSCIEQRLQEKHFILVLSKSLPRNLKAQTVMSTI